MTGLLVLELIFTASRLAEGATDEAGRYRVRNWQTDEGLPQNPVWAIAQTTDGYLWVGTQQGLVRFDGMRFVAIDEKAPAELKHGWISVLCAGRDGTLWIGSDNAGLWRFNDAVLTHFTEAEGLPGKRIRCLLEARDGALWIGTETGLARYREGKFTTFTDKNGLGANWVRALCEDAHGNIGAATARGLSSINAEGAISTMNFGTNTTANSLKGACVDHRGRIWVCSNEGVTCADESGPKFYSGNEGLPSPIATVLFHGRQEGVWVGTYNGVACIQDGKVTAKPLNEAGFGDLINTVFEDREDNLWIGARDGLYRVTAARFSTITVEDGLAYNNVMSVLEDKSGSMWFGTWGGGLNELRGDKLMVYGSTNGLTHDKVLGLHEGRDGSLWIGMDHGGGLNRIKGGRTNSFVKQPGLIDAAIRVIHEDREGSLWIGATGGLNLYRKGKFSTFNASKGLAGNIVLAILEDSSGTIWIGTDDGLSHWNGGKFVNYRTAEGLSHNMVEAIYEDSDGSLWIGTRNGLNRFQNGKFQTYTSRQGLFSDEVYEILEDDFGYFWMSCRTGIFRVRKEEFNSLDRGLIKSLTCTAFGKSDGLPTVQCNGVAKPSGWKSRDGRLWFATIRGAVAVESRIKTNEKPPPVAIEEVIVDRKIIQPALLFRDTATGGLVGPTKVRARESREELAMEISPGRGELEIHYTALSLQSPEKNRFKYKLEGVDSDWIDGGTRHEAFYANVGPGNYRFQVTACNNDGVWSENGASMALVFLPHYWQTPGFKLALLAALGAVLAAWYRSRVARLREIETLRIQIAADLHDDVGARLTKVAMVTELVDRETATGDRNKGQIQNIARTTGEVIRAMDEIVWTINPSNDTLDHLANYLFQHTQEYFQNTGVRCRMDFPVKLPNYSVSTEERHNLFMAVKEALNNALKHSQAAEVRVSLAVENGKLTINIADNGRGFVPGQEHAAGEGLRNMKQRLEQIGGRMTIESAPGQGTRVQMEAKLR